MSKESAAKANLSLVEGIAEDPFYIPATALASRPRRILKHGDSFLVLDSYGDIGATAAWSSAKGAGVALPYTDDDEPNTIRYNPIRRAA